MEKLMSVSKLKSMKWVSLILGVSHLVVIILAVFLIISVSSSCSRGKTLAFTIVLVATCIRIMWMVGTAIAQKVLATVILRQLQVDSSVVVDAVMRHEIQMRYKRLLWWTRFGRVITILQFVGATYLTFITVKFVSFDGKSSGCFLGQDTNGKGWKQILVLLSLILAWLLVIIQCITGSDVLRWRSFYATHDNAWKAHYREIFDHGIREAFCCLGRVKYLNVLEEDEVYAVARVLGELVAYRASGTGHLEFLAGLALLQKHRKFINSYEEFNEAPEAQIQEAAFFHHFAEAAYTGPLLDFGRNSALFLCTWIYRQGVLTPWTRKRFLVHPLYDTCHWQSMLCREKRSAQM